MDAVAIGYLVGLVLGALIGTWFGIAVTKAELTGR